MTPPEPRTGIPAARLLVPLGLVLLVSLQAAHAMYLDQDGVFHGANGPTDHYYDPTSGSIYHYDAQTRALTPAPTFPTVDPLYTQGVKVSLYEMNETMDNVTLESITCGKTFCLAFQARLVGDWNGGWYYRFRGTDPNTGQRTAWSTWYDGLVSNGVGRPVVSGSDTYLARGTVVQNCEVEARLIMSSTMGLGTRNTGTVTLRCDQ
jgi:hypothetical protein